MGVEGLELSVKILLLIFTILVVVDSSTVLVVSGLEEDLNLILSLDQL